MPLHFLGSKSTISRFDERFRDGHYSLVSFLFAVLLLTVPPRAQPFVKVGAHAPVPYGVGATGPPRKFEMFARGQLTPNKELFVGKSASCE